MTRAAQWWAHLRQLRYPKEFRILPGEDIAVALARLQAMTLAEGTAPRAPADPAPTAEASAAGAELLRLLASMATGLWRMRLRMTDPATGQPLDVTRRAFRHLESVWDDLLAAGFEIQDHTGRTFRSGMPLRVLSFETDEAVAVETVTETVRPTIYYRGATIQMGEVIVSTPKA